MFEREEWVPAWLRPLLIGLGVVAGVGLILAALGYLLVTILLAALAQHSPMLAAAAIGGCTLLALGLMVILVLKVARRISPRPQVQRTATILGLALVMAYWPLLMVCMMLLLFALHE